VDVLVPRELLGHVDDALAQRRRLQRHRHLDVGRHRPHLADVLRDEGTRAGGRVGEHQVQCAHLAPHGAEHARRVLLCLVRSLVGAEQLRGIVQRLEQRGHVTARRPHVGPRRAREELLEARREHLERGVRA
jgi:hypothetical protein